MLSGILNANENLNVFSKGLLTFDVENKYETLKFIWFIKKPVPKVIYRLAPFSILSLKYPVLREKVSWKIYSKPRAQVISFSSSWNPSGASLKDSVIPCKNPISGCLYPKNLFESS